LAQDRAIRGQVLADWLKTVQSLIILDGFDEITLKTRRDLTVACEAICRKSFVVIWHSSERRSTLPYHQAVSCGLDNLCGNDVEPIHFEDPFDLREKPGEQPEIAASIGIIQISHL